MTRSLFRPEISVIKKSRQVVASLPVGLFSGGKHRTALVIRVSISSRPSWGSSLYAPLAKPNLIRVGNNSRPATSPVNGRPVRLAPFIPGANPTTSNWASAPPKAGTGALCQLGFAACIWPRKSTNRGHNAHDDGGSKELVTGLFCPWLGTVVQPIGLSQSKAFQRSTKSLAAGYCRAPGAVIGRQP